ncbi:hypothetical protein [Winogradskyella sp.]|uniref:hypothetical protein n=1 Tax=Winogradskyella sp. TaxID=1883156 RepID=UPI001B033582|nr:hypothetical protein [Winogradskyella sp.]MBO6881795.1 hypothetical protein [Winogradskyella sp.]
MKSGRLAVNVLIELYNLRNESKATFDFINKSIEPKEAEYLESRQLMDDYLNWMLEHFNNHNCDLNKLEKLEITFWTDFKNTFPNERNQNDRIFKISAKTKWKAIGKNEETIELSQSEIIAKRMLILDEIPKITEIN